MKLQGDKALSFCRKPDPRYRIGFIYSDDPGVAVDAARDLAASWSKLEDDNIDDIRLQEEDVKRDPALLGDAVTARPLFGGRQLVRVSLGNDGLAKTLSEFLKAVDEQGLPIENYLLITAGDLGAKSNVKAALESSSHVITLFMRADTEGKLGEIVGEFLKSQNIPIAPEALEAFIEELPGDRRLANSEMEKLALYALDLGRPIDLHDIEIVCATERKLGADDAADAALAGNVKHAINATDRFLEAGGSAVSALRTLHFRLLRVLDALAGERFLRPRVSDAEKPVFNKMLKAWNPARVSRALTMLYAAEKTCKQGGAPAEAALKMVIDSISRRAV